MKLQAGLPTLLSILFLSAQTQAGALLPDDPAIPEINMDQAVITNSQIASRVETYGVSTCVVLSLWDPVTHKGALLHVSAGTQIPQALSRVLSILNAQGVPTVRLQARMSGGWQGWSNRIVNDLNTTLQRNHINVSTAHLLVKGAPMAGSDFLPTKEETAQAIQSFIFDLRTGSLLNYLESQPSTAALREVPIAESGKMQIFEFEKKFSEADPEMNRGRQ